LHQHNDRHELELADGEKISAKLVIGADGANSQVRKMAGIGIHAWQYAVLYVDYRAMRAFAGRQHLAAIYP
jgi:2-polyprenyl-6-methoxyphenol hydroxylase-like FAD-dependent oxidoreductase